MEVLKKWLIGTHLGFDSISLPEISFEVFMVIEERGEKTGKGVREKMVMRRTRIWKINHIWKGKGGLKKTLDDGGDIS